MLLAAGLSLSTAAAGETPRPGPTNTRLKWQVRRTAAERAASAEIAASEPAAGERAIFNPKAADAAAKDAEPLVVEPPALAPPARRFVPKTSRSRVRDSVMQVSTDKSDPATEKSDSLNDPFESSRKSEPLKDPFEDEAPLKDAPSELPADDSPPLRSTTDPFPEERVPAPLEDAGEMQPDAEGGVAPPPFGVSCAEQKGECAKAIAQLQRKDITKIVVGLVLEGEGGQPAVEGKDFPCECALGVNAKFEPRCWSQTNFSWKATGTCHKPLYFEDVQLERYGHSWNPVVQPFMSAGHFFVSVPLLPYKMGLTPPNECMYTLGYYRPGNCAPYMIDPIPFSYRAAAYQALGVTGFAFWFWPPATGTVAPFVLQ